MRISLIDVDGHNFPNLPLMKLSAWHKQNGDQVEWYDPLTAWLNPPDRVYMSKVFTFTEDYPHPVCAGEIIKGGTGYEYPSGGKPLPEEIEHIYPDYSLYPELCNDTAYAPYVMIYDKYKLKKRDQLKRMQRWVNSRYAFMACERFEDYTG